MICVECGHSQETGRFCGHCGAQMGRPPKPTTDDSGNGPGSPRPGLGIDARPTGVRHSRPRVTIAALSAAAALAVTIGAIAAYRNITATPEPSVAPSAATSSASNVAPSPPVTVMQSGRWPLQWADETNTVLVFDDGDRGGVAVNLDTGSSVQLRFVGQRPGDQPYRLWRMGGWLLVGWGEIFAVTPDDSMPARSMGDATIFLPAADPRMLWLIDYPGGRIGSGPSVWTLIDTSGETITAVEAGERPVRGVPGGLAVQRQDGSLAKYDLDQERIIDYVGDGPATILDAGPERVSWCELPCSQLVISDRDGNTVTQIGGEGSGIQEIVADSGWLSQGSDHVAVDATTMAADGVGVNRELRIHDTATGALLANATIPLGQVWGSWGNDGQFFYWLRFPDQGPLQLGRWSGGTHIEQIDLNPTDDTLPRRLGQFVALPHSAATKLFDTGE